MDDSSVQGNHTGAEGGVRVQSAGGDNVRSLEQEAAAVLAAEDGVDSALAAADGLEPEYEFQSVEGGGTGSPGPAVAESLQGDPGSQLEAFGSGQNRRLQGLAAGGGPSHQQLNGVSGRVHGSHQAGRLSGGRLPVGASQGVDVD